MSAIPNPQQLSPAIPGAIFVDAASKIFSAFADRKLRKISGVPSCAHIRPPQALVAWLRSMISTNCFSVRALPTEPSASSTGVAHRLENPGKVLLELIEVQSGVYLGEDDIVRFEDIYGRTPAAVPAKA